MRRTCVDSGERMSLFPTAPLTDGLLAQDESADDAFVAAAESEAVASEDDVEGFWNVNTSGAEFVCRLSRGPSRSMKSRRNNLKHVAT